MRSTCTTLTFMATRSSRTVTGSISESHNFLQTLNLRAQQDISMNVPVWLMVVMVYVFFSKALHNIGCRQKHFLTNYACLRAG